MRVIWNTRCTAGVPLITASLTPFSPSSACSFRREREPARVEELEIAEIDDHRAGAVLAGLAERLLELVTARDVELAEEPDDRRVAVIGLEAQLHARFPWMRAWVAMYSDGTGRLTGPKSDRVTQPHNDRDTLRLPPQLINLLGVIGAELERYSMPELPVTPASVQIHSTSPATRGSRSQATHA